MRKRLIAELPIRALELDEFEASPVRLGYTIMLPTECGDALGLVVLLREAVAFEVDEVVIPNKLVDLRSFDSDYMVQNAVDHGVAITVAMGATMSDKARMTRYLKLSNSRYISGFGWEHYPRSETPYGWERFRFIKDLVDQQVFAGRHRLLGLSNPAEMSVYRLAFSDFISNCIDVAVSPICYAYSLYGARFSEEDGLYHGSLRMNVQKALGFPYMHAAQEDLFFLNAETMGQFAAGRSGYGLMREYVAQATIEGIDIGLLGGVV